MKTRAADRWLLAPSVAMALAIAYLLPRTPAERVLFALGACLALRIFHVALITARRDRAARDREVFDRTRRHIGHTVRNHATIVLHGLDPEFRHEAEPALRQIVTLPDTLTLDAVPEPLTEEATP